MTTAVTILCAIDYRGGDQQCRKIDSCQLGDDMRQADEATEHAMAIESVGEIAVTRTPNDVALVPIRPCIGVEQWPQPVAIELRIGW